MEKEERSRWREGNTEYIAKRLTLHWNKQRRQWRERKKILQAVEENSQQRAKSFLITAAYNLSAIVEMNALRCDDGELCRYQDNISFELDFKPSFINDSHNYSADADLASERVHTYTYIHVQSTRMSAKRATRLNHRYYWTHHTN